MKLELKHLAPYLPYGLNVKVGIASIAQLTINLTDANNITVNRVLGNSAFKPILRPLSDLMDLIGLDDLGFLGLQNLKDDLNTINVMTFKDVQYLISKHYDVFGLIDQGLAIDINTLNK